MEFVKDRLDDINAFHCADLPDSRFSRSTASINVYDSVIVFEKKPQGRRLAMRTGAAEDGSVEQPPAPEMPVVRVPSDTAELDSALRRIGKLEAANSALLGSTSWKVTAPLRFVKRLFGKG